MKQHTRIVSDLSSCGPAFMACLLQRFVDAAVEETGIPREEARRVASEMFYGTGQLLTKGGMTPEELQARVAVPGGITAKALALLSSELDGVFNASYVRLMPNIRRIWSVYPNRLYGKEVNGP